MAKKPVEFKTMEEVVEMINKYRREFDEEQGRTVTKCTRYCANLYDMKTYKMDAINTKIKLFQTIYYYEEQKYKINAERVENRKKITAKHKEDIESYKKQIAIFEAKIPQISCETQTETKSYNDCSTNTMPLHHTPLSQVGRLKFRLAYNRIWQRNYEEFIKKLFRGFQNFIMRAFAKHKPDTHKDDGSMKELTMHEDKTQDEIFQLKLKLEEISRELNDFSSGKLVADIGEMQRAIEDLRQEAHTRQVNALEERASIKQSVAQTQSSLAEIRQSIFELKNSLGPKIVEIPAEVSISGGIGLTSAKAKVSASTKNEDRLTGFAVKDHEVFDLALVASKITRFGATLPELVSQSQDIDLRLKSQAAVMKEAKDLIAELRSVTREKLHENIKAKREEEARWLVAAEAERRKNQSTNKKARLTVSRNAIKKQEEQIDAELHRTVPRVVDFVKEWNSLKIGDIYLYKGSELRVDETFNPSIRISHAGQDGDKWEAQKNANTTWYYRGITTSLRF
jgi:hypothetical protein